MLFKNLVKGEDPSALSVDQREELRQEIQSHVDAFLASGGEIKVIEPDITNYKTDSARFHISPEAQQKSLDSGYVR